MQNQNNMAYQFAELPPEVIAEHFPCTAAMHWPKYDTRVIKKRLDGRDIVIQLWKGYCPSYMPGMVGGIGAEVGIYHKSWQPGMWWPEYQHPKKISYQLIYPATSKIFYSASEKKCWWRHKWMTEASYLQYLADNPNAPGITSVNEYRLKFKIIGTDNTITGTW